MAEKEPKEKEGKDGDCNGQFNLDGILSELGSFGKYQLLLLLLLAFRDSFLSMCNYHYVFTAAEVPYRCYVPECDSMDTGFNASWSHFALPNKTSCYRLAPYNSPEFNSSVLSQQWNVSMSEQSCRPEWFDADHTVPCEHVIYKDYNSIVAEFDLGCQPWKRTLVGTVHNLGLIFSFVLSGFISDRYGRKVIIVGTPLAVGVAGLLKSFARDYWTLLVLEFLETALGYGNASMVLSLETVSQNRRVAYSCLSDMLASVGGAFFGLIAWKVPYWRHTVRAVYAPLLVVVFYIFLVDEGVRWLLAHNKRDEAVRVLNKVAKINNITLSKDAKKMLTLMTTEKSNDDESEKPPQQSFRQILSALGSRTIALRVALLAAIFTCCMFVYNGAMVYSTGISGNKYLNYSALVLCSVPTRIITALTLNRFGRKAPICFAYCLCGLLFIAYAFMPQSVWWTGVVLYVMGKMCSSYGLFAIHVVAFEVFPTSSRNSLVNLANTVGRVGSVLAPQTPLLEQFMHGLPSVVFGGVACVAAALALLLPDTSRTELPDSVMAAERLDQPTPTIAPAPAPGEAV